MIFEIRLARRIAKLELAKEEGAHIKVGEKYYIVKGAKLKELEKKFPDLLIFHKNSYWCIEKN